MLTVTRQPKRDDVLATLADLFDERGQPERTRLENGPEGTADIVRDWIGRLGAKTAFIPPRSPWENGSNESTNGKLRNELLDRKIFFSLAKAGVMIEAWRVPYNNVRPLSALRYRPPAPEAIPPSRRKHHGDRPAPLRSAHRQPWRRRRRYYDPGTGFLD